MYIIIEVCIGLMGITVRLDRVRLFTCTSKYSGSMGLREQVLDIHVAVLDYTISPVLYFCVCRFEKGILLLFAGGNFIFASVLSSLVYYFNPEK